ncbi:hypothetical protein [Opitutus terrae]|uniref:hypothetical protein n=1 Tax=Opitutus terrae TaxID=107709 RepID=UPI0002FA5D6C|nr:hypothetical protein [Opitutus terrae]
MALLLAAGCRTVSDEHRPAAIARFYLETDAPHGVPVVLPRSGVQIVIGAKPVFTEYDLTHVEVAEVELGRCLRFQLTGEAARDLRRMMHVYPGRRLVLLLNGDPLGARRIDAALSDRAILVFVELPDEELPRWTEQLQRTTAQLRRSAKPL